MFLIKTSYSNITFTTKEYTDTHGMSTHKKDNTDNKKTRWILSEEGKRRITQTGDTYLYTMRLWIPSVMAFVTSKVNTEDRSHD